MAKKRITLPLAVWEIDSSDDFPYQLPAPDASGFYVEKTPLNQEPVLIIQNGAGWRLLLIPTPSKKDLKRAKGCCDKCCSKCQIPLRTSATIAHFVRKRIGKQLKKAKWKRHFFSDNLHIALEKVGIQAYTRVPSVADDTLVSR
ncbi:MAG: hypothetical protein AAF558_11900 [Verrucomicrobiota bacterium]